jgi:lysozyme family protein
MADPRVSIDFVLRQEDSTLSGVITDIPGDSGGTTRFGLAAKYHPELVTKGFYDPSMPAGDALAMAETAYESLYATPLLISGIASQPIANGLLSFAINGEGPGGTGSAVRILQRAANSLGQSLTIDGAMGTGTLAAVNACDAASLLAAYCEGQYANYRGIVAANPGDAKFAKGWNNRVAAVAAQSTS